MQLLLLTLKGEDVEMTPDPKQGSDPASSFPDSSQVIAFRSKRKRPAVQLNERDFQIFQLIQSEGAKTAAELSRQFWNDKSKEAKAGFQRLRKLIYAGFLERGNPRLLYLSGRTKELLARKQNGKSVEGVQCSGQKP